MEATQGVKFTGRYSGVTLIDGPASELEVGKEVCVANAETGKLYGPYRVAWHGDPQPNGTLTAVAYKVSAAPGSKPLDKMNKAELAQVVAQMQAQLLAITEAKSKK